MIARLTENAWSFDRASIIAVYSALLFVHWNSSLAAYLSLMPDDEVKIAAIPAPVDPHAPVYVHSPDWLCDLRYIVSVGGPIGHEIYEGLWFDYVSPNELYCEVVDFGGPFSNSSYGFWIF